jgi:hypothetical protein
MISPDHPTKLSSHRSKGVLDYEGFFIAQPDPEFNGNMEVSLITHTLALFIFKRDVFDFKELLR